MPANIRYTAKTSNRLRAGVTAGTVQILSATLTVSDLSFVTDKKARFAYDGSPEVIVNGEHDAQKITINYLDATDILQAREWYKSVSDGTQFELDLDGTDTYANAMLTSSSYNESRIGDTLEYSISFEIRWL